MSIWTAPQRPVGEGGRLVVLCCAEDNEHDLGPARDILVKKGLELEAVAGVDDKTDPLAEAIERHKEKALYVLCKTRDLPDRQIAKLRQVLRAHRIPLNCTLTVPLDHRMPMDMVERIEAAMRRLEPDRGAPGEMRLSESFPPVRRTVVAGSGAVIPTTPPSAPPPPPPPFGGSTATLPRPPSTAESDLATTPHEVVPAAAAHVEPEPEPESIDAGDVIEEPDEIPFTVWAHIRVAYQRTPRRVITLIGGAVVALVGVAFLARAVAGTDADASDAEQPAELAAADKTELEPDQAEPAQAEAKSEAETPTPAEAEEAKPTKAATKQGAEPKPEPKSKPEPEPKPKPKPEPEPELSIDPEPAPAGDKAIPAALASRKIRALDVLLFIAEKPKRMRYKSATAFCAAKSIDGVGGWRLPMVGELRSLGNAGVLKRTRTYWSQTSGDTFGDTRLVLSARRRRINASSLRSRKPAVICVRTRSGKPVSR